MSVGSVVVHATSAMFQFGHLKAAGRVEVGMEGHLAVREGDSPRARLDTAKFTEVREEAIAKGLINCAKTGAVLRRLAARDFAVFSRNYAYCLGAATR